MAVFYLDVVPPTPAPKTGTQTSRLAGGGGFTSKAVFMGGFITLHRKLRENPIYKSPNAIRLFIELLLMASHEDTQFLWNGKTQVLKRGQLITGRFELSKALNMKPATVYKNLNLLSNIGIINTESNNKFSVITIVKYDEYQSKNVTRNTKSNNKVATKKQQSSTFNNENNENNSLTIVSEDNTPRKQALEFFNNTTKQLEVQEWLIGKGVPKNIAESEIKKFVGYWTELDQTGQKQRWQAQKFFDLKRRFVTWFGKIAQFNNKPTNGGRKRNVI